MKAFFHTSKRALAVCVAVLMLIGLLPIGGLLSSAATVEYMINGDFETGAVGGKWQASTNAAIVTSPTHGGSYAAKMDYDNGNTMLQGYIEGLSDAATYTFSFWYYVPAGETVQIQLMMQCANSWSAPLGEASKYSVPVKTSNLQAYDTWLQFTKEVTLNPGDIGVQFQLYTAQAGDVYYIDDVSLSATVADPEPEPEPTVLNIDFDVATDKVNSVNYNSTNIRTYLEVETAQTLPIDGWGGYGGDITLLIDDQQVPAKAAGLGSANKFQIYTADGTGDFRSASTIVIPAGATFTSGIDSVVFPKEFKIVKKNGAWVKYEPPVIPGDHTTSLYPEIPEDKTHLAVGGDFSAGLPNGWGATSGLVTVENGLVKVTDNSQLVTNVTTSLVAGHTYVYTMYYWVTEVVNNPQFLVQAYYADANGETGYQVQYSPVFTDVTAGWNVFTFEYTLSESANNPYRLSFQIQSLGKASTGTGTMYVDDVTVYDRDEVPFVPVLPTDHGGDTEIPGNAAFVNMQNMTFDLQTWHSKVGNTSIADGMAKILVSGSDDYLQLNTVSVKAGVEYTLAFYIWVTEASADFDFNLYMATSAATPNGTWCDKVLSRNDVVTNTPGGIKTTTDGWQRVTLTWTPAADGDIAVGLKNYGGSATGTIYIDDASLTYEKVVVIPTDHGGDTQLSENAVGAGMQNGDFNATVGQNWMGDSSIVDGMAKIAVSGTDDYIQFNGNTVKAGVEYTLAFYVWVTEASADFDFNLYMTDAGSPKGGWLDFTIGSSYVTSNLGGGIKGVTDGWQYVTVKWVAPADGGATFGMKNYGGSATGTIYIDDVSLTYEETIEYIGITADMVSLYAAQQQEGNNRSVFGLEIKGVNIPFDASWRNFGYVNVLVDGATENAPFGTTAISDTWGIGEENKMLLYLSYAAYDASTITIPQGTKLIHPADPTLAYEFTEDVVITKGSAEWPIRVLLGSEVELGETLKADVTMRIPSVHYEEGMKLQVTVDDESTALELTAGADSLYSAQLAIPMKNMNDVFTLQVVRADGSALGNSVEYSIKAYAEAIITNEAYDEKDRETAKAMLWSGYYAQQYFGYKNEGLEAPAYGSLDADALNAAIATEAAPTIENGKESFVGYTLVLKDVTTIRLYFRDQVTGSTLAPNGLYYLESAPLTAADLGAVQTFEVDGATYTVSVYQLCKLVVDSANYGDSFKNLVRALYNYGVTATK